VTLVKKLVRDSLEAGNSAKQILPFGVVNTALDAQLTGTNSTIKDYILQNVRNVNFIDPLNIVGIPLDSAGGLLVITLEGISLSQIRAPNLNDTGVIKKDSYYIYETSANQVEVDLKNAIILQNLT
jgi:cell division ATPase FtsA